MDFGEGLFFTTLLSMTFLTYEKRSVNFILALHEILDP